MPLTQPQLWRSIEDNLINILSNKQHTQVFLLGEHHMETPVLYIINPLNRLISFLNRKSWNIFLEGLPVKAYNVPYSRMELNSSDIRDKDLLCSLSVRHKIFGLDPDELDPFKTNSFESALQHLLGKKLITIEEAQQSRRLGDNANGKYLTQCHLRKHWISWNNLHNEVIVDVLTRYPANSICILGLAHIDSCKLISHEVTENGQVSEFTQGQKNLLKNKGVNATSIAFSPRIENENNFNFKYEQNVKVALNDENIEYLSCDFMFPMRGLYHSSNVTLKTNRRKCGIM